MFTRLLQRAALVHADVGQHARRRGEGTERLPEQLGSRREDLPVAGAAWPLKERPLPAPSERHGR
jgi:hypothetical protein